MGTNPDRPNPEFTGIYEHLAGRDPVNARARVILGLLDENISDELVIQSIEGNVRAAQRYAELFRGIHQLTSPENRQIGRADYTRGLLAGLAHIIPEPPPTT